MLLKKVSLILFLGLISFGSAFSQKSYGTITYKRTSDWIGIFSDLPWVTEQDITRRKLTRNKRWTDRGVEYKLYYGPEKSLYQFHEDSDDFGWGGNDEIKFIRDYKENKTSDLIDLLGRTYLVKDDLPKYKWKILNEIREIAGYLCMKAETQDTIKNRTVVAWFATDIPAMLGPEGYGGLPGMILGLEFNGKNAQIMATKVELSEEKIDIPFPKKIKGREVTRAAYNEKLSKAIEKALANKRNPYWQIRY